MGLQRPCWTISFVLIWLLLIPGAILTHLALVKLIPEISDLPANIITGFDETFKFAYLEADSNKVKGAAADAVKLCTTDVQGTCAKKTEGVGSKDEKDVSVPRSEIMGAFQRSLDVINKVVSDKYFGIASLNSTATSLETIMFRMPKKDTMTCYEIIPSFCAIYSSGNDIMDGLAQVNKALDGFKESDIIKQWDERKGLLTFLHALPYVMVLGLLFFTIFWWKGGVCCCCKGGSMAGLALIPFIIFWLVSFLIYVVVLAGGIAVKFLASSLKVPVLNGEPTLEDAIDHIQTNFSDFWNVVFADMVEGLSLLFTSSAFFTGVALTIGLYTCCLCCARPYLKKAEADKEEDPDHHTI